MQNDITSKGERMYSTIIFDVDGTLWDATDVSLASYRETLKSLCVNKSLTQKDIASYMGLLNKDIATKIFSGYSLKEQSCFMQKLVENENEYLKNHPGKLYKNVKEVLQKLQKKYNLMIVSNCQEGYIELLFKHYSLQHLFTDYAWAKSENNDKADNIRMIMQQNLCEDAIYVGDTQTDYEACKKVGIPFIYASYGFGECPKYDHRIDCFQDLTKIL